MAGFEVDDVGAAAVERQVSMLAVQEDVVSGFLAQRV